VPMLTVDPLLCVGVVVFLVILFVVNIYTFAYWSHPDDKNESVGVRVLIIAGLQLSGMSVLFLPIGTSLF
jgi:uncharacterized membrane protein